MVGAIWMAEQEKVIYEMRDGVRDSKNKKERPKETAKVWCEVRVGMLSVISVSG